MPNSAGVEVARISVKVSPNTKGFHRELKRDLEEIEKTLSADIEVNAHLSAAQAKADMRRLLLQLQREASRGVNVPVDLNVDRDRAGGGLDDIGDDADKAATSVRNLGTSFLGMSRYAWMGVGILAAAAPAVGLISGLLAGLPSLIGAAGVGIGAIALGMDGIKAAAKPLTEEFEAMKTAVSSTFEQALLPQFQQLQTLMPMLTSGMQGVASGMSSMFQGVTDALTKGAGPAQLEQFLANTKGFFEQLQPVANQFTQSFLTLANAGSGAFGYLTGSLEKFSTQFNDMVNRVTSNGVFDGAMKGLSQTLDGVTNLFTRLMESGLQAMSQLGGPLNTFLTGIGDLLVAAMPALTSFASLIGNVLGTLGTALAPIVTALTPAFTMLADTLGTLLTSNLQALSPVLTQVATLLGGTLTTALQAIQPMLPGLMESFSQLANVLVTSLAPHIPALATAFGQLVGAAVQLAPMIMQQLVPAFVQLVPKIAEMLPSIVSLVQSFASLMPVVLPLASALLSVAGAAIQVGVSIGGALIGAMANLMGIISGVIARVAEWVSSFASGASQIAATAAQLPGQIQAALSNLMNIGLEAGRNLVQGLINGIQNMISSAVSTARNLASSVADAVTGFLGIHSPSKLFEQFGINTGQGYAIGLDKGFAPVLEQAKALAGQVAAAVATGTEDPTALLQGFSKQDVSRMEKVLGTEIKKYERQAKALELQAKATGNEGLKAEAQKLRDMKDQLQTQKEMLDLAGEYNDETDSASGGSLESQISKLMAAPVDFAKATGKQFLSDIGISGEGFLSKLITEGTQYIFQIGSVDEALDIKDRQESKDALAVVGRQ
ncbi:tape measure protein [Mycobacterium phage RedRock]|uniref:Tape measure protein n=1 Tax=Mycobacterium phage RedRock TaxID=711470 RepID=D3JZ91_9CAUD|nr:tail length tape measure protein [Mycobacterium phage RedRock]ADB93722.1 tape measure protein [Mycobacterium phage RedRock]